MALVRIDSRWIDSGGRLHVHEVDTSKSARIRLPELIQQHFASVKRDAVPGVPPIPGCPYITTKSTEGPLVTTWTDAQQRRHSVYTERDPEESRAAFEAAHAGAVALMQAEFPPVGP